MKNILLNGLYIFILLSVNVCQAQIGVKYQGVAINEENILLVQQLINVKLQLVEASNTSSIVWDENHSVLTDDYGYFELNLSEGVFVDGLSTFDLIDWSSKKYLLNVLLDVNLDDSYVFFGSNEIRASIYALDCEEGQEVRIEKQELSYETNLNLLNLTGNNNTNDIDLSINFNISDDGSILSSHNSDGQLISEVNMKTKPFSKKGSNFDFPEGQKGEFIFLDNEVFTVPENKNFYLLGADAEIDIKIGGVFVQHFTTPNMPVLTSGNIVKNCGCSGVLVDKTDYIIPVIIDFSAVDSYTVPEDYVLVVKSGLDNDDAIEMRVNDTDCKFLKPNETRGTIIVTIPSNTTFSLLYDQVDNTLTGYLVLVN